MVNDPDEKTRQSKSAAQPHTQALCRRRRLPEIAADNTGRTSDRKKIGEQFSFRIE